MSQEDFFCITCGSRPAWVYAKCLDDYFAGLEASDTRPDELSDEEIDDSASGEDSGHATRRPTTDEPGREENDGTSLRPPRAGTGGADRFQRIYFCLHHLRSRAEVSLHLVHTVWPSACDMPVSASYTSPLRCITPAP